MRHYHIHNELQDAAIWTWPSSKGQTKVNIKLVWHFDVENIFVKLRNDTGNSCRVIVFTRQLDLELVWKFKNVTQRSMSNSAKIVYVENNHVNLQHDTGNLWRVIAFARFRTPPAAQATTIPFSLKGLRGKNEIVGDHSESVIATILEIGQEFLTLGHIAVYALSPLVLWYLYVICTSNYFSKLKCDFVMFIFFLAADWLKKSTWSALFPVEDWLTHLACNVFIIIKYTSIYLSWHWWKKPTTVDLVRRSMKSNLLPNKTLWIRRFWPSSWRGIN